MAVVEYNIVLGFSESQVPAHSTGQWQTPVTNSRLLRLSRLRGVRGVIYVMYFVHHIVSAQSRSTLYVGVALWQGRFQIVVTASVSVDGHFLNNQA